MQKVYLGQTRSGTIGLFTNQYLALPIIGRIPRNFEELEKYIKSLGVFELTKDENCLATSRQLMKHLDEE